MSGNYTPIPEPAVATLTPVAFLWRARQGVAAQFLGEYIPRARVAETKHRVDFYDIRKSQGLGRWASPELGSLATLKRDWDSYGASPPNQIALDNADDILSLAQEEGLTEPKVMPCADDGVTIVFAQGRRSALIECFNTGEIVLGTSSGPGTTEAREVGTSTEEMREALQEIAVHLDA